MKAVIFGVNGQDGFYLKRLLESLNIETIGVSRSDGNWIKGDVTDKDFIDLLIKTNKPNYIFHLAALSKTNHQSLFENHEIISTGTLNILESVFKNSPESKVFLTGSGLQFINNGTPIDEEMDFYPNNAYSLSRIHSVYAARYYRTLGLRVYIGYLFHHESSLRKENHISKKISEAVARIYNGSKEKIVLGDPMVQKEWTFAGDVASAIVYLLAQDSVFEVCIGSGKTYSILDWLKLCFSVVNMEWEQFLEVENNFISEYKILVSNPALIKSLGWDTTVSINELASKMVAREI